jgi:hypothetical protein
MFTVFKPDEKKEIFDAYAAKHMLNRWGKYGIVEVKYDEKEARKYDDFDEYEHELRLRGTKAQLEQLEEQVYNYQTFDENCGDKKSPERRFHNTQAEKLKKRIADVQNKLKELEKVRAKKTPEEKAKILIAKADELRAQARALTGGNNSAKSA